MMDFSKAKLPPIYRRNGKDCYLDPIRQRLIYITPEETIRQKVISFLLDTLEVPADMIHVEDHLSHYGLKSRDRADIVICGLDKDGFQFPLAVIECKAETVPLDNKVFDQAADYSDALGSVYTVLTNGHQTLCYKYDDSVQKDILIEQLPKYDDMLTGECVPVEPLEPWKRIPYEELEKVLLSEFEKFGDYHLSISKYTSGDLALPALNLLEGLMDSSVKMPTGNYGLFELLEDYGVRTLTYGNASSGQYYNLYRSFLVKVDGNTEFYSLSFNVYRSEPSENNKKRNNTFTILCVAHDDEKTSHHSLQLSLDQCAVANGKTVKFYHNGRISIGNIGSGKTADLKAYVKKRCPKILKDDEYYLGSITADHLLRLDEPDVIDLIANLISYAIVRDEFREIKKQ